VPLAEGLVLERFDDVDPVLERVMNAVDILHLEIQDHMLGLAPERARDGLMIMLEDCDASADTNRCRT